MKLIKKFAATALVLTFIVIAALPSFTEGQQPFDVDAKSAVLMEAETGTVLYSKNADEALPPASVTKVMTLLLVMEAVDSGALSLDEEISVSEYASSMGGSQVFLEPGEKMTAGELIKCVSVASANDAAVALAERVCGSEEAFVNRMNERAAELGLKNTRFENVTGLDDDVTDHVTSAFDIAVMSRELMRHEKIFDYTTLWTDTIRNGAFGLTNTNRLIRFYSGATGLKTGSTSKAKFCISATAKRDGMHLIAVIMGAESRDVRNEAAKKLLDWGFATYALYRSDGGTVCEIPVRGGKMEKVDAVCPSLSFITAKASAGGITRELQVEGSVKAPVKKGDPVGTANYFSGGKIIFSQTVTAAEDVGRKGFSDVWAGLLKALLLR